MARGVNKVILLGNLGNDPDCKYTQGGMAIVTLSLATSSSRKDRDGNQVEKTEWHRVKAFGKLGEICAEYLTKGRQVYVEGRIEYGSYEKDGVKHYTTDVIADQVEMLGGGGHEGGGSQGRTSGRQDSSGRSGGERATSERAPAQRAPQPRNDLPPADDFADDDIPF